MLIEVFADIWCPFAYVGLKALAAERQRVGRDDVALVVRSWPLEWVNGEPMEATHEAELAAELRRQVAPHLFAHDSPSHFPASTIEALALVVRAYRRDVATGEKATFVLRDALFEQGRDIGDAVVLAEIAAVLGVGMPDDADRAAVRADWEEGKRRGVVGSPHFFAGGESAFCPALQISRDTDHHLVVHADHERLAEFVQRCLRLG